jgi:hypothetical protein
LSDAFPSKERAKIVFRDSKSQAACQVIFEKDGTGRANSLILNELRAVF